METIKQALKQIATSQQYTQTMQAWAVQSIAMNKIKPLRLVKLLTVLNLFSTEQVFQILQLALLIIVSLSIMQLS